MSNTATAKNFLLGFILFLLPASRTKRAAGTSRNVTLSLALFLSRSKQLNQSPQKFHFSTYLECRCHVRQKVSSGFTKLQKRKIALARFAFTHRKLSEFQQQLDLLHKKMEYGTRNLLPYMTNNHSFSCLLTTYRIIHRVRHCTFI